MLHVNPTPYVINYMNVNFFTGPITSEFRNNAIKQFEKWVDWENSPRADEYRSTLLDKHMKEALVQAKEGRLHILGEMAKAIDKSRDSISDYAPTITTIQVHKDKIREVIGKGGAVIREITEKTGAKIEINDVGLVSIAAVDGESGQAAIDWINSIVEEPEIGKIYEGKVVKLMDFGAFVNFMGSRDGLVHISQLKNERVEKVSDVVKEGDVVKVKVLDIDGRGKVKLSMKEVETE